MDSFKFVRPFLHLFEPEAAHRFTLWALRLGLVPVRRDADDPRLAMRLWDLDFPNPVGLAAGFDKGAAAAAALLSQGFGFVEAGSVTPRPQPGNPGPRIFRLAEDRAAINRMGFNSEGHDAVARRLATRHGGPGIVGVNLGANRDSADRVGDYADGVRRFAALAGYLVVNISSPNTPGLRDLQMGAQLDALLERVLAARDEAAGAQRTPVLLKIDPDLDDAARADIARIAEERGVDGLVVSNTTAGARGGLKSRYRDEAGGLSGAPLFAPSTEVLRDMYRRTGGRLPLIGAGGVASGDDAYAKIKAGASLVQVYTALVFDGPPLIGRIKRDLAALLAADGVVRLAEAVGVDA